MARSAIQAVLLLVALPASAVLGGCEELGAGTKQSSIGDAGRGAALITEYGCGGCHIIPGVRRADGLVGPPLDHMGRRVYLAGVLRNTPANMIAWLRDPQSVVPGTAMPDVGLSEGEARDIAAYLFTLE